MSITEDEFFERLGHWDPDCPELLKSFLVKAEEFGVYADLQGALSLKHTSLKGPPLNMGTIQKDGQVEIERSTWWGRKSQGQHYNEALAKLIDGHVKEVNNGSESAVRTAEGRLPRLPAFLPRHEQAWLEAMEQYIRDCLAESAESEGVSDKENVLPPSSPKVITEASETVLQVGGEGGSITLLREREAGGNWRFQMKTNETALCDALSEEDRHGIGEYFARTGYVRSFDEGLPLLDRFRWVGLQPLKVHPEFLDAVLREVNKRGGATEEIRWREQLILSC